MKKLKNIKIKINTTVYPKRPEKGAFEFTMGFYSQERYDTIYVTENFTLDEEKILYQMHRDLIQECKYSAPSARLTKKLRRHLEMLPPQFRRALIAEKSDGCAALFTAARRGNIEVVEYLIDVCNAPIEQTGVYEVPDIQTVHVATPLWVAGVNGHIAIVTALLNRGAKVNAVSNTGSTTLRSACFMTHHDIVHLLISVGADVNIQNYNRSTCLINCVQSAALTTFLIEHGADVNATDLEGKTALHYAALEDRIETARVLLANGADPRIRTVLGDDVIRTAAIKGSIDIVEFLEDEVVDGYTLSELADTYEVLGATLLEQESESAAIEVWKTATAFRSDPPILKVLPPPRAGLPLEWSGSEELEVILRNNNTMLDHGLAVLYRVLGVRHPELAARLMNRGSTYVEDLNNQRGLTLWTWALQLRVEQLTLLDKDTSISLCAWTRLAVECWWNGDRRLTPATLREIAELLLPALKHCSHLLSLKPHSITQQEMFDCALRCVTHIMYLMIVTAVTEQDKEQVVSIISELVSLDLRAATGDTLLHLAVSRLNQISTVFVSAGAPSIFPSVEVVRAICECGVSPDCANYSGSTPIHVASIYTNYNQDVLDCLLSFGAHIDRTNRFGDSAYSLIWSKPALRYVCLNHIRLTCLSAAAVPNKREAVQCLPKHLREQIEMHMS